MKDHDAMPGVSGESYWDSLRVSLTRFFEGPPIGRHGTFHGVVLTVFKFLAGNATLVKNGVSVSAGKGEWMVCHPGIRFQHFSDSARIFSIHLKVECPGNMATWTGGPVLSFADDAGLNRCVRRIRQSAIIRRMESVGKICPQGLLETFVEALELHEAVFLFTRSLMEVLEPLGMRYVALPIRDARVRESRHQLATMGLREPFTRQWLASKYGLSAAQLDRLWRSELDMTPALFWHQRRLHAASTLLLSRENSIKQVAYETGFDYPSQFSNWFAENMGESPRTFRDRHEWD
ncbi:AraC family transcriptional regulator [Opitutaceae bacterium TAV5]|nr:AraC family transcriptional regulator [Opitutaceae bacterium TAV5]